MLEARRAVPALSLALAVLAGPAAAQGPPASTLPPGVVPSGPESEIAWATAPVVLDGTALFRVRGVSTYPAEERAARISERILEVARNRSIAPDALKAVPEEHATNLKAGEFYLLAVTEADARLESVDRATLAGAYLNRIQLALQDYRAARQPAVLWAGARRSLLATVALLAALVVLIWAFRRLEARIARRYEERIRSLQIQSFEILRAQRLRGLLRSIVSILRGTAAAVLVYFWLGFVLGSFAPTRPLAARLLSMVIAPLSSLGSGLVAAIPDLAFLFVLFLVVRWLLRLTQLFFDAVAKGNVTFSGFEAEWALPTYRIVRVAIIAFGLVVAYPYIPGSRSAAFQGISIFLGVMFSIGSSTFVANIIAGYAMTYRRAFRLGDRIKVEDVLGDVTEIRLQVTHLRSVKNEAIVVPNSTLLGNTVVNYSALARTHGLILHTTVGIGYETPWRQVEAMLLMAAERTAGVARDKTPYVLQKGLGDFCVTYEINVYCDDATQMGVLYTRLHQSILDVFNEYGVQIMTPAYEGDPEQPKVVPREQWFAAPAHPAATAPAARIRDGEASKA